MNTAVYLAHDDEMGWLCFDGNVQQHGDTIHFSVLDSSRSRVFLAPIGLWITLDAGHFSSVDFDTKTQSVRLHLAAATAEVNKARLRMQQTEASSTGATWKIAQPQAIDAGASVVPLGASETVITLNRVNQN